MASDKLVKYLLCFDHPRGEGKAHFFHRYGFSADSPEMLRMSLLILAHTGRLRDEISTPYGRKYIVDGEIPTPVGRSVRIRSVWFRETDEARIRFVTAYPMEDG